MNHITFVEGVPGVGKTTLIQKMMTSNDGSEHLLKINGDEVIPENMVRRNVRSGKKLTIEEARTVYASQSYQDYLNEHLSIWRERCLHYAAYQTDLVVDAGLIQSPLYELIGLYQMNPADILHHIEQTLVIIKSAFLPHLIYIAAADPAACIEHALEAQKNMRKAWQKGFHTWLSVAPYPVNKGYEGDPGIAQFAQERYRIDQYLFEHLQIDKTIYYRD